MKHSRTDLAQMQSLPLYLKERMSESRVRGFHNEFDNTFILVSGGKDSAVLRHLVQKLYPDTPSVFVNTGLEYTAVRKYALEHCDIELRPKKTFKDTIIKYGYPIISKSVAHSVSAVQNNSNSKQLDRFDENGRYKNSKFLISKYKFLLNAPFKLSDRCCDIIKKEPSKRYQKENNAYPFLGTLANESQLRYKAWLHNGCNVFKGNNIHSAPLSFWTEQDILQYIKKYNLDIAEVYGKVVSTKPTPLFNTTEPELTLTGVKRTGCVFCLFGINSDKERFKQLKEDEPKLYDYIMRGGEFNVNGNWVPNNRGLGYWFVLEWLNRFGDMKIWNKDFEQYKNQYGNEQTEKILNANK